MGDEKTVTPDAEAPAAGGKPAAEEAQCEKCDGSDAAKPEAESKAKE